MLEALRVIEEHARFVCEDGPGALRVKALRHRLQGGLADLQLLDARDVAGDPNRPTEAPDARPRLDAHDVLGANFGRAKEGLRALEEYSKVLAPQVSVALSEIRYAVYALEQERLAQPPSLEGRRVYAILGSAPGRPAILDQARALLEGGVRLFQLREKGLDDGPLLSLAQALVALCAERDAWLIVNDRPDVARLAGATGVHLGTEDLPPPAARRLLGPRAHVGSSVHDGAELAAALETHPTYLGFGTLFASRTKPELGAQGLERLRDLAATCPLPIYGIGGVTRANARSVLAAGAFGVAVSSDLLDAPDPARAAAELVAAVEESG